METELDIRISRKSQMSFNKRYSEFLSLDEFMNEMRFFLENNPKYKAENLFSLIFDRDIGMCVTLHFDRNYYVKHKYKKGKYTIIGFTDLIEMEEGLDGDK